LQEPFASERIPEVLVRDTRIKTLRISPAVGITQPNETILSHLDGMTRALANACAETR
jgi:hypothetical protein